MINHPTTLDAELQIETFLTDIRREYLPNDIFDSLSSEYINPTGEEPRSLPNSIYLKLSAEIDAGRTCKVPMIKELSQAPTIGANGDQRLNEEEFQTKYFRMEYTDLSHATTNQAYGLYARDKAPYKIFEYRAEGLAKYFKQYFGKMRRQALLELQSENLEDAPHFNAAGYSPNWFIPNRSFAQQPNFCRNKSDWTDRITATLHAAGTGVNACASLNFFVQLERWARDEAMITPIEFEDGGDGYIVTLPTPQVAWLKHVIQNGNPGAMWQAAGNFSGDVVSKYPGFFAQFGGLRFVADQRYATLTLGGSASQGVAGYNYTSDSGIDYSLTAQYRGMGNADDGSSDPRDKTASARQIGFLIGKAALCEWMPENFHWEWEYEMYDKYFGSGIFCSVGIKQPIFDSTAGVSGDDDGTIQQNGSIVIPFAAPPETSYYTQAA
jgi:hypothetical protein